MTQDVLSALICNSALLLSLSIVFAFGFLAPTRHPRIRQIIYGVISAVICVSIMANAFEVRPGILLDARTISVSMTALLFGPVPAIITASAAVFFRILNGGAGLPVGLAIIFTSLVTGLVWRKYFIPEGFWKRAGSIFGLGLVVHATMIALVFLPDYPSPIEIFYEMLLPVGVIFPISTVLFGALVTQMERCWISQHAVIQAEERYHLLFQSMSQGVVFQEEDGRIVSANPAAEQILGYTKEQMLNQTSDNVMWDVQDINGQPLPACQHPSMLALHTGRIIGPEVLRVFNPVKNGYVWISIIATPLFQQGGDEPYQVYTTFSDISDIRHSEEKYQQLFQTMLSGFAHHEVVCNEFGTPIDYRFVDVNPAFEVLTGLSAENIIGKTVLDVLPRTEPVWIERYGRVALTGIPDEFEERSDELGKYYHVLAYQSAPGFFACIFLDITARREAEEKLEVSERQYRSYISEAPDAICITDSNGQYIDVNPAMCSMTGLPQDQLLNMSMVDLTDDESAQQVYRFLHKQMQNRAAEGEFVFQHKDGSKRWWAIKSVYLDEDRYLQFTRDMTDRKTAEQNLLYLSYHDQMTGVYNRRFFEEEIRRLDTDRNLPISIIMGDINGLKIVNDSFGHEVGDQLLERAAECIKNACRKDDIVARLGGDEFVVLLPNTSESAVKKILKRVRSLVAQERIADMDLSISFGQGTKNQPETNISDIFAEAENSMYRNKLYEHASVKSKTVDMIMKALFAKSEREMLHSNRVSRICRDIAVCMDFDQDAVERIRLAGLVHDIGKIGIAEQILNKPGNLNASEWESIQRHPEAGWRILSATDEFSELAGYVFEHQEHWDGTGYPRKLRGSVISVEARIIAVADAYDAMTRDRSYRKAMSQEEVVREMHRCAGTQFDPDIVQVFLDKVLPTYSNKESHDE